MPPAAVPEPASSPFGATIIEGTAKAGAGADVAFDSDEGVGIGLVKTIDSEVMVHRPPEAEPENLDSALLKHAQDEATGSPEDEGGQSDGGFGFVFMEHPEKHSLPANEGEEEPKGAAVFGAN